MLAQVLTAIAVGCGVGAIYGLVGLGYSVVYSSTGVFNLAQGDLLMVGTLLSYYFLVYVHLNQALDLVLVVIAVTLLSIVEERFVVRPFLKRPGESLGWFIATLAFSIILEGIAGKVYGDRPPGVVPSPLSQHAIAIGPIRITAQLMLALAALLVLSAAMGAFYKWTWIGKAMRATAEDRTAASLRGIPPATMSAAAFAVGGFLAGLSAFVVAPIILANPSSGITYSVDGFLVLAIGGFGSLRGVVVGALALGASQGLFDLYASATYDILAGFLLLVVVLVVRPTGMFGQGPVRSV
jgi:branched-chain amino acid transport system permease protein